jgi:RNA polymerase sigma-70 factor (ECF subfamily)
VLIDDFERERPRLRAVAYRMLGSLPEADDALQETWLKAAAADTSAVRNLAAWLTTVVARTSLNLLRTRGSRPETHLPDPLVGAAADPLTQTLLSAEVGFALQVVLDTLGPDERLAFVLHDLFAVPFDDIAAVLGLTPVNARQLASRARRRVRSAPPADPDPARQRAAVAAFFAAAREGDFMSLLTLLHPDAVLRADGGPGREALSTILRGARTIAGQAVMFHRFSPFVRPAVINGAYGVIVADAGGVLSIMAFTVADSRITEINVLADPARLARLVPDPSSLPPPLT